MKINWNAVLTIGIVIAVLIGMYNPFMEEIKSSRLDENHCIKEEMYYYRIEQGLIFSSKVETTKERADDFDYRCLEWEEEPSFGATFLGQKLIYEKGSLIRLNEGVKDDGGF